jgi:hypothetical protein
VLSRGQRLRALECCLAHAASDFAANLPEMARKAGTERGTRLADLRPPRYWPLSLIGGLLLARWFQRRRDRDLTEVGEELGEVTVDRWQSVDAREERLLIVTARLARLTWALLLVAAATLAVAIATVLH